MSAPVRRLLSGAERNGRTRAAGCLPRRLDIRVPIAPFHTLPETGDPVCWVRPAAVVEVTFEQWTRDGKIRNPRFEGRRSDKAASDVVRETTA